MIVTAKLAFQLVNHYVGARLSLLVGIVVAVVVYATMMLMTKVVTKDDLKAMDKNRVQIKFRHRCN